MLTAVNGPEDNSRLVAGCPSFPPSGQHGGWQLRFILSLSRYYLVTLSSLLFAAVTTPAGGAWQNRTVFVLYLCAVLASAYFDGMRAGLLATGLCGMMLAYQHALLPEAAAHAGVEFATTMAVFVVLGLVASYLSHECFRSVQLAMRFHDVVKATRDGVVILDHRGRAVSSNRAAAVLLGWPDKELKGRRIEKMFAIQDDDAQTVWVHPLDGIRDGQTRLPPRRGLLTARDGTTRPIEYWVEPRDTAAAPGAILFIRDLTERRQQEEDDRRFRALVERSSVGLVWLDSAGRCTYSNAAAQELGRPAANETLADAWARALHPEDLEALGEWRACATRGRPYTRDLRFRTGDGRMLWYRLRSEVVRLPQGQAAGHVGTLEPISEARQLADELAAQKEAAEAQRGENRRLREEADDRIASLLREQEMVQQECSTWRRKEEETRSRLEHQTEAATHAQARLAEAQRREKELRQELETSRQSEGALKKEVADSRRKEALLRAERDAARAAMKETEGLQAERDFWRQVIEEMPVGVVAWRRQEDPMTNPAGRRLLGLESGDRAGGWKEAPAAYSPENGCRLNEQESPFLRAQRREPFAPTEVVTRQASGGEAVIQAAGSKVPARDERLMGYVLTLQDVTRSRRGEKDAKALQAQASRQLEEDRAEWQARLAGQEAALRRAAFRDRSGERLLGILDPDAILETSAALVLPDLAEACIVYQALGSAVLRPWAVGRLGTAGPEIRRVEELTGRAAPACVAEAMDADPAYCAVLASSPPQDEMEAVFALVHVDGRQTESPLCLPLVKTNGYRAAMLLLRGSGSSPLSDEDLRLAEEFAARVRAALAAALSHGEVRALHHHTAQQHRFACAVLTSLGEGMCALDGNGTITLANPAAERLLQLPSAQLIGRTLAGLLETPSGQPLDWRVASRHEDLTLLRSRERLPIACTTGPLNCDAAEGAVVLLQDWSGLRRREETLRRQIQILEEEAAPTVHLWACLADQLAPLARSLRRAVMPARPSELKSDPAERAAGPVEQPARRLDFLAATWSLAAQLARGEMELRPEWAELGRLVKQAVEAFHPFLRERGQHLTIQVPLGPVPIVGDPSRLEDLILRLLDAAGSRARDGGQIHLRVEHHDAGVVLNSETRGPELPVAQVNELQKLSARARRLGDGKDAGLAVARDLAELHGGTFTVMVDAATSAVGFTTWLPRHEFHRADEATTVRADGPHGQSGQGAPRLTGWKALPYSPTIPGRPRD